MGKLMTCEQLAEEFSLSSLPSVHTLRRQGLPTIKLGAARLVDYDVILRIIEAVVPDADHSTLRGAAIGTGAVYANVAKTQPAFTNMDDYLCSLRQQVCRMLTDHGIGETKIIREKVEDYVIHA
jgi:hypothetical protein